MRTVRKEAWFSAGTRATPEFPDAAESFRRQQDPLGSDAGRTGHRLRRPYPETAPTTRSMTIRLAVTVGRWSSPVFGPCTRASERTEERQD